MLGHLQRGGSPTAFDRILATRFGAKAVDLIAEGKYGYFPALQGEEIVPLPMEVAISSLKVVPLDSPLLDIARSFRDLYGRLRVITRLSVALDVAKEVGKFVMDHENHIQEIKEKNSPLMWLLK